MSPQSTLRLEKKAKSTNTVVPEPDGLDWAFTFSNEKLRLITKTKNISSFCKIQHYKYIAHVSCLENSSLQKQLLFTCNRKKYARDPWVKMEKELKISKMQIQKTMQHKKEFMSLLHQHFT